MNEYYNELTSRNGYFINKKLQKKIKNTTLVFLGCGMASNVITSAVRIGFTKFVLIDGDNVEINNLNRQDFINKDIGKNKAKVMRSRILAINEDIQVKVISKFVKKEDAKGVVESGDVIVNCADFNEVTYELEKEATKNKKLSISPLNIGFGSVVSNFSDNSSSLEELTNGIVKNDKQYLMNAYKGFEEFKLPNYIKNNIAKIFLFIARKGFFPQNVIATQINNALIIHTIIRYLDGKKIKESPLVVSFDPEGVCE